MNTLQTSIMWDRYALKEKSRDPQQGDNVIVSVEGHRRLPGKIKSVIESLPIQYDIEIASGEEAGYFVSQHRDGFDVVKETEFDIHRRLARAAANTDQEYDDFYEILESHKFVPGGRIMANLGSGTNEALFNCFVIPSPEDSRGGILKTLGQMVEIMSRGGGVGINLSSLRPKDARVRGVDGKSSGAVSWGKIYADTTELIIQGGSRRGALMLMMDVEHPDILDFIKAKQTPGQYTGCNMSVVISDAFMEAVKEDCDWFFYFPDTTDPEYKNWTGDRSKYHGNNVLYGKIKARELWTTIMESAWKSGEPGVWFRDRANADNPTDDPYIATNPCGEMPLAGWGVCNLGALNLGNFVCGDDVPWVNWMGLGMAVETSIIFLDNIIDKNHYTFEENKAKQLSERKIGLGVMGLADMLVKMGIRYGSPEAVEFCDNLFGFIKLRAVETSSNIAKDKCSYPAYSYERHSQSAFFQRLPKYLKEIVRRDGIRNVTLLTVAPTGTTGTMIGASTGIEPYFALEWERTSRLGTFKERVSTVEGLDLDNLPDYFVTAQELTPEEHIRMQAVIQSHIDSSISKTINLPSDTTVEGVANVYQMMYDSGCKGGTIYRDQSRNVQVLNLTKDTSNKLECPECKEMSLVKESGCSTCSNCGYSVCSL